jgi:putative Mn2+ efflux pump MntP
MKARIVSLLLLSLFSPLGQAFGCAFCYGAKDGHSSEHLAVAIWVLFGAVMSVMSGIGVFSLHLWRHGRMPIEPHHELAEEDLEKYDYPGDH